SNDAWVRDSGPTFVINDKGDIRGIDWEFNAWGGLFDGLYFPWDADNQIPRKICDIEGIDTYHTPGFVMEGGSIHVDGEGTVITTEMCLLSPGRNPHLDRKGIEDMMGEYLNVDKVVWLTDGIDPEETNGHIDDVACFVRPGEVACIWTDDKNDPFYDTCHKAYAELEAATDAKGRKFKIHKLCMPKKPVTIKGDFAIDEVEGTAPREDGDLCIASYMNFLIINDAVIIPQYEDENDALAVQQIQAMYPDRKAVGVNTREVVYGGGNIHCITQQQPKAQNNL
ncbi:MAG: agmatine deiminase, partial [Anaerovoracaceae bacterium]